MELRAFGHTGLTIPAVGMGTWSTFDVRSDADVRVRREIVSAAIEVGTTLFDTSPMYGQSAAVLAKVLEGKRQRALIADKVWTPSLAEGREQIRVALERFGTLDIYQIHNLVAWRDHLPVLEDLRAKGSIRAIGATHYAHTALADLMSVMRTSRVQMVQVPYNAADRIVEREVLPLAHELGLGVLVMKPLGSGKLVGRVPPAQDLARLEQFGVTTWAQVLLKWVLSDPRAHCVIPATSKPERVAENARAGDPPWFDDETREYVAHLATRA